MKGIPVRPRIRRGEIVTLGDVQYRALGTVKTQRGFYRVIIEAIERDGRSVGTIGVVPVTSLDRVKQHRAAAAVRRRGHKGGLARATKLSPERRSAIAKKAAAARWNGKKRA